MYERLKPHEPWPPLNTNPFVGREDEIAEFRALLRSTRSGNNRSTNNLQVYHGPAGIGKTVLAHRFAEICHQGNYPHALIDFTTLPIEEYAADPSRFFELMATSLLPEGSELPPDLETSIATLRTEDHPDDMTAAYCDLSRETLLYRRPKWVENLRQLSVSFYRLVRDLQQTNGPDLKSQPVIFIFDGTDFLDDRLISWMETWLFGPMLTDSITIWTGRHSRLWSLPEIRWHEHTHPVDRFSDKDSSHLLQTLIGSRLNESSIQSLLDLTHGHPGVTAIVAEAVNHLLDDTDLPLEITLYDIAELSKTIYQTFIEGYVLHGLTPEEKQAIRHMALMRKFGETTLNEVLSDLGGPEFADWSSDDYHYLMTRLKATGLLAWRKDFTVNPHLRQFIHQYFRLCEPEIYIRVHQHALRVNNLWLSRPVDSRSPYIIEELYHLAMLQQAGEPVSLQGHLDERLSQHPKWHPNSSDDLLRLLEELNSDPDLELFDPHHTLSNQITAFIDSHYS